MQGRANEVINLARSAYAGLAMSRRLRSSVSRSVSFGERLIIGSGSRLWAPTRLRLGNDVSVGSAVRIEVDGTIGDHVLIANGSAIVGRRDHDMYEVGTSIRFSRRVHDYPYELSLRTHIGSDVWIGFGAIILSGVTIGDSAIVGAGAIVISDVPPNAIAVGSPARVVGQRYSDEDFTEHWRVLCENGVRRGEDLKSADD